MNKFETKFFSKYIPEWQEIKWVIHVHFIKIFSKLFLWMSLWLFLPTFLYYVSVRLQEFINFMYFEIYLIIIFIKFIYDIFDWYNDVWILTNIWIVKLNWKLFKTITESVTYDKIEWLEVQQWWLYDKMLRKWNLIIHKMWDDILLLENSSNPYKWVNKIETASEEATVEEIPDDKFDIIMDALWWVVENYLDRKMTKSEKQREIERAIEEIELNKWTLDLR